MSRSATELGDLDSEGIRQARDFRRYEAFLLATARRILGRSLIVVSEASDFVQDTFVAARQAELKGQGPPDGERKEAAWLRITLKRKILEAIRRKDYPKYGGGIEISPLVDAIAGSATTPSEAVRRKIRVEAVHLALSRLPARSRIVLVWEIGEGVTCKEIGERLGIAGSYVCRIRDRALEQLKIAYAAVGGPSDSS